MSEDAVGVAPSTRPALEISIGRTSVDSRVVCNGVDISRGVRRVVVEVEFGKPTRVTLEMVCPEAINGRPVAVVKDALDAIAVIVPKDRGANEEQANG